MQLAHFNNVKCRFSRWFSIKKKPSQRAGFIKEESGGAAIEFAFLALPFILILVFTMEIGVNYFASKILQINTDKLARAVQVGSMRGTLTRASIIAFLYPAGETTAMNIFNKDELLIEIQEIATWNERPAPKRDPTTGQFLNQSPSLQPGGSLSINVVSLSYKWPSIIDYVKINQTSGLNISTLWQNGGRTLTGRAAFQIEPL